MLSEIAHETGEIGLPTRGHLADRQVHRKGRSVTALAGHDATDADDVRIVRGAIACDIAVVAGPAGVRRQGGHILADRLVLGPAEQRFRGRAEELDDAVAVDDDHGIGNRVEDRAKMALARAQSFLDLLLLVDIDKDAAEMTSGAGFVPDDSRPGADPLSSV